MAREGYLFWDDETANPQQRICQVGYCLTDLEGNPVGEPVCQLVDPESEFSPFNVRVHHIAPGDVAGAPNFARLYEELGLGRLLEGNYLVAHNAKGADVHHIRKSLAAYGMEMPSVELVDTQQVAIGRGLPASLKDLCRELGVELRGHHDALADALACRDVFWVMGGGDAEAYSPAAPRTAGRRRGREFSGLGYVNGSEETVENALEALQERGLRGDPFEVETLEGLRVVVSGIVPGYNREGIKAALVAAGAKVSGSVSGRTQYLAIGDNVGRNKLDKAGELGVPVITVGELLDVLNR
ncbi:exonuclease domain-containing protein [Thermophilibacter mediterraneus]|uniref:exonuclease domain-containing protein n=1 Tax=Thermophilibacter mediterraneus TaxID=1871031 RepID=UPI0032093F7C